MILELAEGPRSKRGKYITVEAYKRKNTVQSHKRRRPMLNSGDYHVYVPPHLSESGQGLYVREDFFDDLSDSQWNTLMDGLLEFDPEINDGLSGKGKARRQAKRKAKADKKKDKYERRQKRKDVKAASKAQKRLIKANAKADKTADSSGGDSGGGGGGGNILDSIIDKGTSIIDKVRNAGGGGGGGSDSTDGGEDGGEDGGGSQSAPQDTIMGIPKPIAIGGGIALGLGILYLLTKNKK